MKFIGEAGRGKYICEVSHTELEKFLGLYYGKMKEIRVGDEIDLGAGHNHAAEISDAMRKTREFIESNSKIIEAILNGMTIQQ